MLKEVGASGQISLGKKFAGQLFDLQTQADGSIVLQPVKVVPVTHTVQEPRAPYAAASTPSDVAESQTRGRGNHHGERHRIAHGHQPPFSHRRERR